MKKLVLIAIATIFTNALIYAQVTKIPSSAKDNFAAQYPAAQNAEWDNDVVNVNVNFTLNGEKHNAEYSNKGIWKSTSKSSSFEALPENVKKGFELSKFSDRDVTDVKIIYYPAEVTQYRLKVEKNDIQKKYLFFNSEGKLLRDAITL